MPVARWMEWVSGALLVGGLVAAVSWWSTAVVAPRDRLLECGSNEACRAAALDRFTVHRVVSARLDQITR